jgi:hypothetical protein
MLSNYNEECCINPYSDITCSGLLVKKIQLTKFYASLVNTNVRGL